MWYVTNVALGFSGACWRNIWETCIPSIGSPILWQVWLMLFYLVVIITHKLDHQNKPTFFFRSESGQHIMKPGHPSIRLIPTLSCAHAQANGNDWLLSQHQFGWPEHRPRSYTIMLLKGSVTLDEEVGGIQLIHELMRAPTMPIAKLLCAPKDSFWEIDWTTDRHKL